MTTICSCWGTYLSAQPDGRIEGNRDEVRGWEEFTAEPGERDGSTAFRSHHGTYLSATPDGVVTCDKTEIHDWESWTLERQPNGTQALKSAHGLYLVVEQNYDVRANRAAVGEWEQFTVTGLDLPVPVGADPIVGTLRADYATGTADDHGPRLVVLCHAGDLLARAVRDPESVGARLDEIAAAGYQGVRTWTVLYGAWWASPPRPGEVTPDTPEYWHLVEWFGMQLAARELKWLVSQGDLMRWALTSNARREFMRRLASVLAPLDVVCGVDAGNETWQNGEPSPSRLADALDAFLDVLPVPVRTLTSPQGEAQANDYLRPGVLRDIHSIRSRWPQPGRYVFNMGYDTPPKVYTVQSEGPGYGAQEYRGDDRVGHHVSATDVPEQWNDNDPEIGGTLAALHAIGKALYVWFSSPGVISDEPFTNYAAFSTVPRLYAMLPRSVQSWRTFHGGNNRPFSPDRVLAVPDDDGLEVRCDHAGGGDQRVCVAYGPAGTYRLRSVNHFEGVLIHPGTLGVTPVTYRRDEVVTLDWRYGRVLVGRVS